MSHDRGCRCGREQDEYRSCPKRRGIRSNCNKESLIAAWDLHKQEKAMNTAKIHSGPIQQTVVDGSLNGYQIAASATAIYPGQGTFFGLCYCGLKLAGEAGEFTDKVGKQLRDAGAQPGDSPKELPRVAREAMALELGDQLWYIANAAKELGYTLEQIATMNIQKLLDRQQRGMLSGSGDKR